MLGKDEKRDVPKSQEMNAFLGEGTEFDGKLTYEGTVRLDGKFRGEIFTEDTLIVGPTAEIEADIIASVVVISGRVRGNITAKGRVELHHPGSVEGDIKAKALVIRDGAIFNGHCLMREEPAITESRRDERREEIKFSLVEGRGVKEEKAAREKA